MNPNKVLIKHTLRILDAIGASGLYRGALMEEMYYAYGRPITTAEAEEALTFCTDQGWISSRIDEFDSRIYWITDRGKNRYRGL